MQVRDADTDRAEDNQGISKFKIISIEDGDALIESLVDSPGTYPFRVQLKFLVPAT